MELDMPDVPGYPDGAILSFDSHETWLGRQHELLGELSDLTDLPRQPPPRTLPELPWWKDENRVNGEAQRILDGMHFAWEVFKAVLARLIFNRTTGHLALAMIPLALFMLGFWLGV